MKYVMLWFYKYLSDDFLFLNGCFQQLLQTHDGALKFLFLHQHPHLTNHWIKSWHNKNERNIILPWISFGSSVRASCNWRCFHALKAVSNWVSLRIFNSIAITFETKASTGTSIEMNMEEIEVKTWVESTYKLSKWHMRIKKRQITINEINYRRVLVAQIHFRPW